MVLGSMPSRAQPLPDTTFSLPLVRSVSFSGNTLFRDETLRTRVRTQPNRRLLNIPGVTWWLWLYQLGEDGPFGKAINKALVSGGELPAFLNPAVVAADVERLRNFYEQEGFRAANVNARIDTMRAGKRAHITFEIDRGPATFIRRVAYDGLDKLNIDQRRRLARNALIVPILLDPDVPLHYEANNQRYAESVLLAERRRILTFLRNEGFARATRDSIRALVFPHRPDSFDITFRIRPGPRYRFGDVQFIVNGPEPRAAPRADTVETGAGTVEWQMAGESKLDAGLLRRTLRFNPGDYYDLSRLLETKRRLEATGVFAFTDILALRPDTVRSDSIRRLPHRIDLRTRRRHQVRFETFVQQRSGAFSGADDELGTGLGGSYANANLLGGGETYSLRLSGALAASLDSTLFTSGQAEVATSLIFPYLIKPFSPLDRRLDLYDARTRLSFSLLTARRTDLGLIIRGRGNARGRLEMQHTPTVTSLVDLLDISLSNPDTLGGFQRNFLDQILGREDSLVTDPVQRAQILEDYTQPQINNALRYTFRAATVNPLRRDRGYSYEAALEVGGNLPYLLDRFIFTPDIAEGTVPGLPFFGGGRQSEGLLYRQYVRFVTDVRHYQALSTNAVLALKFIGGIAHPTGKAQVVPFDRRFYSGGALSVRGWRLRDLGPGAASFDAATDGEGSTNILGGDIKLEAAAELRSVFLRNVLAADWLAVIFADAGNVWFGPRNPGFSRTDPDAPTGVFAPDRFYREIGVGTGTGLRIAFEYLIVRFDLAYKIYDPGQPDRKLFPDGRPLAARPTLYFGIGHAF